MAKLDFPGFEKHLGAFDFARLFVDVLGWNHAPAESSWQADAAGETTFTRRTVAELGGVVAIQVVVDGGWPDEPQRLRVWKHIAHSHVENLLIFTERQDKATQSQWYWVKRDKNPETGKPRLTARRHDYFRGQPVDLFASKLQAMVVELSELDATGRLPVLEAARRIQAALDVEKTTKKFFTAYQQQHLELLAHIKGIYNERDKRWYASVLLNRLMFVWFMQKKFFLDGGNADYLSTKLTESQQRGPDRFFGEFLNALFFEAFAKPEAERSAMAITLTGQVPYLNGGLFLHHKLELDANHTPRVGTTLTVADVAFTGIFDLFAGFTWHLDDTPGGDADEINPDVLGYIFEKYINQKAFGAYYTRPEITGYLAERSIHRMILERVHEPAVPELNLKEIKFATVSDLLARMDAHTALKLANDVLPSITILDPAVGSGAFLVAALKCLINVYYAIVGRAELGASTELQQWLRAIRKDHPSVGYYIKRRIVTDNLHGVDIMEEACEIAKLRLFLAMVSSVRKVEDLEPLPNIDFNIVPGNSLVGLMRVDEHEFNSKQDDLFKSPFRELLASKNRKLDTYRHAAEMLGKQVNLQTLRDDIDSEMQYATGVMNELLRDQFEALGVKFEEAQWDAKKRGLGKPKKRRIERRDIDTQTPFHWGYVFDDIVQRRGGFDIILANPPWEVFQTDEKEFFVQYDNTIQKNKLRIEDWSKQFQKMMAVSDVREAWLEYVSRFPHMARWYKKSDDFRFQTSAKINLYLLFVERSFHLLRPGGHCGIVIPGSFYTDLGAAGLRRMLFDEAIVETLISLSNEKYIFEGVHHAQKFCFLTFEKGGRTLQFQASFRINPREAVKPEELTNFLQSESNFLKVSVDLVRKLSPDSNSVMEFKSEADIRIAEKMLRFPLLGEHQQDGWNLRLCQEFNMTTDSHLFKTQAGEGRLPLWEGKQFHQFDANFAEPRYWLDEKEARAELISSRVKAVRRELEKLGVVDEPDPDRVLLNYDSYRMAFRDVTASTNERTVIATVLPPKRFCPHTVSLEQVYYDVVTKQGHSSKAYLEPAERLYITSVFNSFVLDWFIRKSVTAHVSFFFVYNIPMLRLSSSDPRIAPIVKRAARLICTTPEFDDLAKTVGLKSHLDGATDPSERARLRAELDGLVAHLYGLSEEEFVHILGTFPLVPQPVKVAAHNAYRDVERGLIT